MRTVRCIILCLFLLPEAVQAQSPETYDADQARRYAQSIGGLIILTNSGFGLGGHMRVAAGSLSLIAEMSLGAGKDAREVAFFDRFGRRDVLNKANYFLMLPLHVGIEKRLFADRIEDDFRPFVLIMAGPTLGWEYPYFTDANDNGILDEGEKTFSSISAIPKGSLRPGFGATVAIGAHFGSGSGMKQGVRIGYTFARFRKGIELLERGIQEPQTFFGTPSIIVYFARLW
ncbi:hypothetical protein JYT20_00645 [Rhodothermus sp. AH-315-K08]|nr:hypothetical protein [Rhodothermus sp. AH-315-K08]